MQKKVVDFIKSHQLETDVATRMLDLVSEVGELSKEILKSTDYGKRPFVPNASWHEEMGDAFFSLICIANSTGVDLERSLSTVLDKYQKRIETTQSAGSGS